jgi:uncharacterized protein
MGISMNGSNESRSAAGPSNGMMATLLLWALNAWRAVFSPLMPFGCKFDPTCSRYASEAIERHGALRGSRLAALRLLRCRPFTQGGFDPVPDLPRHSVHDHAERNKPGADLRNTNATAAGCTCSPQKETTGHTHGPLEENPTYRVPGKNDKVHA